MVAVQAIFFTFLVLALIGWLVWSFLIKPVAAKAEVVMDRADESYEIQMERERLTEEERKRAEEELTIRLGDSPKVDDK